MRGMKRVLILLLVTAGGAADAQSWSSVPGPRTDEGPITGLWGRSADDVWAVTRGGTIMHSTDRGRTFTHLKLDADRLSAIGGTASQLLITGPGAIYRSPDGASWTAQRIGGEPDLRALWTTRGGE